MFPPLRIKPTCLPRKRSRLRNRAASPAAPAPSTTVFSTSSKSSTASSSASSSTSRISLTSSRTSGRVSSPGLWTAIPSARVALPHSTGSPARHCFMAGETRCLHAHDLDLRADTSRRDGDPCDEAAATDRDDQGIELGKGLEQLERDGSLSADHVGIVVGVNQGSACARARAQAQTRSPRRVPPHAAPPPPRTRACARPSRSGYGAASQS